jgi:formate dehydrogenase subunit gamma
VIADIFNISQAEVRGIVSFYDDFTRQPARHRIRICQAEACQALGSRRLTRELETSYATSLNSGAQDAPDDLPEVVLEPVYCLGLCAVGPAAEIDGRLGGRATVERLEIPS